MAERNDPSVPKTSEETARPKANAAAAQPETMAYRPAAGESANLATFPLSASAPAKTAVPGYDLLGELGRGGMGVVYKARQHSLNRVVALKMILSGAHAGADELARFKGEAEAAARLQHPNMVQVYEVGEAEGRPFLSLEFAEGGSLADKVKVAPFAAEQAALMVEILARAIHHAHQRGIIHRDLKPANVLLTADGIPKITDFGLAKLTEGGSQQTHSGAIQGTPSYMAPEQAGGRTKLVSPAIDVYALGAILYDLLTGRPPFHAADILDTLEQVRKHDPLPPSRLQPTVPYDLETICLKCLHKQPRRRYASALELAEDLRRFLDGEAILARPTPVTERIIKWVKRRPTAAALIAVILVAVLGLFLGALWYGARLRASHAADLVESLASADIARVPRLVEDLVPYRLWADPLLRKLADDQAVDGDRRLRANLALIPSDANRVDFLTDRLLDCSLREFPVVRDGLAPHGEKLVERLQGVLRDERQPAKARFHAGMALAQYAPDAIDWTDDDTRFLAGELVQANRDYQRDIRAGLKPLAGRLLAPLQGIFHDGVRPTLRIAAADALADFAADQPDLLAELASDADAEQYDVLRGALTNVADAARLTLRQLAREQPARILSEAERSLLGRRRAGAAITLVHLGDRDVLPTILQTNGDPEARTQFIHRLKDRGLGPRVLLDSLQRAAEPSVRSGLLLALGEFRFSQVPDADQARLVDQVLTWHRSDPSSAVHSACGWLLRTWNVGQLATGVDQAPLPFDPAGKREWFVEKIGADYFTFVVFPAGSFLMGSPESETYRHQHEMLHRVRFSRPLAVADREVTRRQFEHFLKATQTTFVSIDEASPTPDHPMVMTTWAEAVRYCRWLTSEAGLDKTAQSHGDPDKPGATFHPERAGYRLPTEAEWEYACRAGTTTTYSFGSDRELLSHYGRYLHPRTSLGGTLRPNPRGLFDMHGNVWEWCQDLYQARLDDDQVDPVGAATGSNRTLRGGGWDRSAWHCRSAYRHSPTPDYRAGYMGFRIVKTLPPTGSDAK